MWIAANRGLVYVAEILVGDFKELAPRRTGAIRGLDKFCAEKNFEAFPIVVIAENFVQGVSMVLQSSSVGPIRPNVALWG